MLYELAQLAVRNLMRARARLFMTSGGVLVGTAAVILLIAATIGLQQAAEQGIGQNASLTQITVSPGFQSGVATEAEPPELNPETVATFWRIPGVEMVIPVLNFVSWGEIRTEDDLSGFGQIMGIDPQYLPYLGVEVAEGSLVLGEGQVLFGSQVPLNFFDPMATEYVPQIIDAMNTPLEFRLFNNMGTDERQMDLNVAGVLASKPEWDYAIIMPIQDVIALNEWVMDRRIRAEDFKYDMAIVRATSRETTAEVSDTLKDMGFNAGGIVDFINQLNGFFTTMRLMLGAVGGIALLVAAFGVANTMTMAILERTREIGLMKAVGATDRDVLTVFLIEAALVGLFGGIAGVSIAYVIQNTVNNALANAPPPDPNQGGGMMFLPVDISMLQNGLIVIPSELAVFGLALATGVGIAAGLFPALRAARMTTVVALKTD
jgi:putative ABC transport system permease protein